VSQSWCPEAYRHVNPDCIGYVSHWTLWGLGVITGTLLTIFILMFASMLSRRRNVAR
jgi:hypothetical protein